VPPQLHKLGKAVADLILPQFCLGCGRAGEIICSVCLSRMPRLQPPLCARCGLPQNGGKPCRDCSGHDLAIDGIRSPLLFESLTREAVHQLKYQNIRVLARPLAALLCDYLTQNPLPAEVLVPVPLHPRRLRERGYNQSDLLCRELAKLSGIATAACLKRKSNTPPQARTASVAERHHNMLGAFACLDGKVRGKKVLLIDDVATSGATLNACAVALKQAEAASVWGLALAREV